MEEDELELIENILEQAINEDGEYCRIRCNLDEEDLKAIAKLKYEYEEAEERKYTLESEYRKLYFLFRENVNFIKYLIQHILDTEEVGWVECNGCKNKDKKCIECRIEYFKNKMKGKK